MKGSPRRLLVTLTIAAALNARADTGISLGGPANATGRAQTGQPAIPERSAGENARLPAELAVLLPPMRMAQQAVLSHPRVRGADSGSLRERAAGDRLRAGAYETHLEFGGQRSKPGGGGKPEADWSVTISRQIRLPAKRDADLETGRWLIEYGRMAALDARHETARMLLSGWFELLRQEVAAAQAARQVEVFDELSKVVGRRLRAGDAARLEQLQADAALAYARGQHQMSRQRADVARIVLEREFPEFVGIELPRFDEIGQGPPGPGDERSHWVQRIVSLDHELGMQRAQSGVLRAQAARVHAERTPDPSIGVSGSTDRAREDRILGVFVSIPLTGAARVAAHREALALADEGEARYAATERRVLGAAQSGYEAARSGARAWEALSEARARAEAAARLAARAFELGEGTLTELLFARRSVLDSLLTERTAQIDAFEAHARLGLDAHLLWDFDEH